MPKHFIIAHTCIAYFWRFDPHEMFLNYMSSEMNVVFEEYHFIPQLVVARYEETRLFVIFLKNYTHIWQVKRYHHKPHTCLVFERDFERKQNCENELN